MTDEQAYEIAKTVIQKYLMSFNTIEAVQEAFSVINKPKTALIHIEILLDILEKAKKFLENEAKKSEIEKQMLYCKCKGGVVMDKDILLDVVIDRLDVLENNLRDMCAEAAALKKIIEHFKSEEKDEETTIEDEIMSCLKDIINNNDSFKDVKIKVVKVDEDDD